MFLSFHPLADKTNNEHLLKPFFKVIQKIITLIPVSSFQTESELQELIREVEENPAPPDAPQPPTPKTEDMEGGKQITGFTFVCYATYNWQQNYHISPDNSQGQLFCRREGNYFKYCSLEAVP